MKSIQTARFGLVRYSDQETIEFPAGLPGFEDEHQFLLIESPESRPFKFLQSVASPKLSFVCAPLELVARNYESSMPRGDREILALPAEGGIPGALEWLAILCFADPEAPTANLLGPIVLRRDVGLGVQSIREDSRYSARHPLFRPPQILEGVAC